MGRIAGWVLVLITMGTTALPTWSAPPAGAGPAAAPLTLERIFGEPPLQGRVPTQLKLSDGGAWASFLQPSARDSEVLELWAQPTAGGAPVRLASADELLAGRSQRLTEAEAMALERRRITHRGITEYQWCGESDRSLLFPLSGDLYVARIGSGDAPARRLTHDDEVPEQDPACSRDGRQVAYVKNGNLWVQSLAGGEPRALTIDATPTRFYGLAEFVAAEEFERQKGFWWSPDGQRLLVLQVDESEVPLKRRAAIFADRTTLTEQRYPAAGEPNARVTAFVVDAASGRRMPLPLPADAEYVVRAGWFEDGTPWLQSATRDQTRLALWEFDRTSGAPRQVLEERDEAWVEPHDDLAELTGLRLSGQPALLWSSEASGRRQLVVVDRVTGERRALTAQAEAVMNLVCTDGRRVVFAASTERGRASELFVGDLQGRVQRLGGDAAHQWRRARGDRHCQRLLVTRSSWGEPPQVQLRGLDDGAPPIALAGAAPDPLLAAAVSKPRPVEIVAADGTTALNTFYFPPTAPATAAKHPVLAIAYGGPGGAMVTWRWSTDAALIAYWQRLGFGVFVVDTRGANYRDRAFTRAHRAAIGRVEVDDLFAAVRQLPAQVPQVDPARIGFFGWSYGGFLGVRAMLDEATPFAAAVAVAPVTDWTLYDTVYTERYLGLPLQADRTPSPAYRQADLVRRAALLRKPLLIVHGTADDNVLFEHSLRLMQALQEEGRLFETGIYPGKAHGLKGRRTQLHLYRTMQSFLQRHLQPAPAAAGRAQGRPDGSRDGPRP